MTNQWCRLWHDMPSDPKWRTISRVSGQSIGNVMAVFCHLMTNASANATERGRTHGWTNEDIATALDVSMETIEAIMEAMQGRVLDDDQLSGWDVRQPKREDESAARAKAWRQEKKARTQPNATERNRTLDTDTDTDTEEEKKEEEEKETPPDGGEKKGGSAKYAFDGRIIKLNKGDYSNWAKAFHGIPDLKAELESLDRWHIEHKTGKSEWFNRVASSLTRKHQEFLKTGEKPGYRNGNTSGNPFYDSPANRMPSEAGG